MQYLCSCSHKHAHTLYLQYTLSSSLHETISANERAYQPSIVWAMRSSGVSGTCMKIKKLGQLYLREEKSRVLRLSSPNAAMERSASALLSSAAMQAALLFNLHLSLSACTPFLSNKNQFSSCLAPDNIRDITKKHLDADTSRETKQNIYSLPQMNPVLSLAVFLMADNSGMMHNVTLLD